MPKKESKEEPVTDEKQFVLKTVYGPDVRFTGRLVATLKEDGATWDAYQTVGGNWIVDRSKNGSNEVRIYKKEKKGLSPICQWMRSCKNAEELEKLGGHGLTEKEIEFVSFLSPTIKEKFVRDVE